MNVEIRAVRGHYEAFVDGQFYVSGDTYAEVMNELNELEES